MEEACVCSLSLGTLHIVETTSVQLAEIGIFSDAPTSRLISYAL
jgi:hypothetical protein